MTKGVSLTPEAITIDDMEISLNLDHETLFKTLKGLLDDEIKTAIEVQFTAL